jgi:hypothetical protein
MFHYVIGEISKFTRHTELINHLRNPTPRWLSNSGLGGHDRRHRQRRHPRSDDRECRAARGAGQPIAAAIEWLSDNGSPYTAVKPAIWLARSAWCHARRRSRARNPNGMAEAFVKTQAKCTFADHASDSPCRLCRHIAWLRLRCSSATCLARRVLLRLASAHGRDRSILDRTGAPEGVSGGRRPVAFSKASGVGSLGGRADVAIRRLDDPASLCIPQRSGDRSGDALRGGL